MSQSRKPALTAEPIPDLAGPRRDPGLVVAARPSYRFRCANATCPIFPDRRRKPQAAHDGCQEPGRSAPGISGHGPDTTEPKVSCQEGPGMVPLCRA